MSIDGKVRWTRLATVSAATALLAACATAPIVRTRMAEQVSLSSFHTFAFVRHPGTDSGKYKSLTTQQLEHDVGQALRARGFVPASGGETADLLVNFHITTHNRVEGGMGPGFASCGWGWGWGWGWGMGPWGMGPWGMGPCGWGGYYGDVRTVSRGALTIDLINHANRSVVWSGTAVQEVTRRMFYHPARAIDQAVSEIFAHFPIAAR